MRVRRIDIAVVALTLAFVCFLGGYFTGRRSAVNIVTVAPQSTGIQAPGDGASGAGAQTQPSPPATPDDATNPEGTQPESDGSIQEQPPEITATPQPHDGRININTASRGELMDLSGIGEVLAGRIIDYRNQNGFFTRIEDIMKVTGIGERRFEAIKDMITV